jgi:hypothetical protein
VLNDNAPFPLSQWFDLSKRISRQDRELAEAQMPLYAYKENGRGHVPLPANIAQELRRECRALRAAAKAHNAKF